MSITLKCGHTVHLVAFYTELTYAGLLAGIPTPRMNAEALAEAPKRMVPLWGNRETHIIPPIVWQHQDVDGRHHDVLPIVMNFALLKGSPIDPEFNESELVVGWFAQKQQEEPLINIVSQAVHEISWVNLAKDYHF